jgi:small multidrug resistance pump
MIGWVSLAFAIITEVIGTTMLKESNGFSKLYPSIATVTLYCISFYLLSISLKTIPMNISYAIWAGVGTVLIAGIGFVWYKEAVSTIHILFLAMIIIGCVGLQITSESH